MDSKGNALRQQMSETRAGLTGKLEELEQQVTGTVRNVKNSVNTVRDSFDVKLQMRRHPWTFMAGAAALGFLGGFHPNRCGPRRTAQSASNASSFSGPTERTTSEAGEYASGGNVRQAVLTAAPRWMANLGEAFKPEIAELRGVVIGGLVELAREMLARQVGRSSGRDASDTASARDNGSRTSAGVTSPPAASPNGANS